MTEQANEKDKWTRLSLGRPLGELNTQPDIDEIHLGMFRNSSLVVNVDEVKVKAGEVGDTHPRGSFDDSIERNAELSFKKVKSRRELMDMLVEYITKHKEIEYHKLAAYFQYTTGASQSLINQSIAVLENLDLIKHKEVPIDESRSKDIYYI